MDLENLSETELRARAAEIALALERRKSRSADDGGVRRVYDVLSRYLAANGRAVPPLAVVRKRSSDWIALRDGAAVVSRYVRENVTRRRTEEIAATDVFVGVLARDLVRRGIPVSFRTLTQALRRAPEVVDAAFPGYREAGLLPSVLARGKIRVFGAPRSGAAV